MFGSKKRQDSQSGTTLIARNTRVEGALRYAGDLHIEGHVAGDIYAEDGAHSVVKILENGRVDGEVHSTEVVVNGHVAGDIHATKQLYLAEKAVIEGNVHYATIEIERGAQINGKLVHVDEPVKAAESVKKTDSKATSNNSAIDADIATANT